MGGKNTLQYNANISQQKKTQTKNILDHTSKVWTHLKEWESVSKLLLGPININAKSTIPAQRCIIIKVSPSRKKYSLICIMF